MQLFEFGTESSTGWEAHASGIETILQLFGPQIFTNSLGLQLFYFYRTIGVCPFGIFFKQVLIHAGIAKPHSSKIYISL